LTRIVSLSPAVLHHLSIFAVAMAAAATPAGAAPASDHLTAKRYQTCIRVGEDCGRRVEEGDIPYASFRDRSGQRPRVRVCVRDRDGRYCLPRQRVPRNGVLYQPVLYKNTGRQLTTWHVNGKVVGRWRWRVVPEPE
jgi:hypothetical protein